MPALQLVAYGIALWLGCYLLARQPLTRSLAFSGLGLLAYAGALAVGAFASAVSDGGAARWLLWLQWPLIFMPALCWCLALAHLASGARLPRWWSAKLDYGAALAAGLLLISGGVGQAFRWPAVRLGSAAVPPVDGSWSPGWLYWLFAGVAAAALLTLMALVVASRRALPVPRAGAVTLVSALFFGLGSGLLLLPATWVPRPWLILAIGLDLLAFGWVVAVLDAFDAGERVRVDFVRSLIAALALVAVFGGQVVVALALGAGPRITLTALLLGIVAGAIGLQAFWDALQGALDRMVLGGKTEVGRRRAALRAAASALTRQPVAGDPLALPEEEFTALTRRALSHFGDLPKLAASPLARLPSVERHLSADSTAPGDVLERAAALKALLAESVARLKPRGSGDFGTTDEWRFYNALYFPYVLGLRPYSRRQGVAARGARGVAEQDTTAAALHWFRAQVPERTLFNWQRAAAKLVALDVRARALAAQQPGAAMPAARGPGELAGVGSDFHGYGSG